MSRKRGIRERLWDWFRGYTDEDWKNMWAKVVEMRELRAGAIIELTAGEHRAYMTYLKNIYPS